MMSFHVSDLALPCLPAQLVRVEALSNYSKLFFSNSPSAVVLAITLGRIEAQLPAATFLRVHRSHLVNKEYIKQITGDGAKVVELQTGEKIAVSRRKRGVVKSNLAQRSQAPNDQI